MCWRRPRDPAMFTPAQHKWAEPRPRRMSPNGLVESSAERVGTTLFAVSEIEPSCLYLAGASVLNERLLNDLGISCLVSACPELPPLPVPGGVTRYEVPLRDVCTADIASHIAPVSDLIDKVKEEGGKTLVHCVAGVSRSASLCIGYLIRSRGMLLEEAYHHVLSCRPCIRPNNGFFQQLIQLEKEVTGSTTVEMIYTPKGIIPNVYLPEYENTIRYINRSIGIK